MRALAATQQTATASPMFDLWATEPDTRPYVALPNAIPEALNPPRTSKAPSRMSFDEVDNAPGLGRELWRHMKGTEPPWELPWDPDEN